MKATGIVRRMDDLGRVVIPKEIRRTLRIREGDSLEIYTEEGGGVVFRKYSPMGEMEDLAARYSRILTQMTGFSALVCDRDRVVAVGSSALRRVFLEKPLSKELSRCLFERELYAAGRDSRALLVVEGENRPVRCLCPILCAGDVMGGVLLLQPSETTLPAGEAEQALTRAAARFLGAQLEE